MTAWSRAGSAPKTLHRHAIAPVWRTWLTVGANDRVLRVRQLAGRIVAALIIIFAIACNSAQDGAEAQGISRAPRSSEGGLYLVGLRSAPITIPVGNSHAWIFHVETLEGEFFSPYRLSMSGTALETGSGLEMPPSVTVELGNGDHLVEGVQFPTEGEWVLRFDIVGPSGPDRASFRIRVTKRAT